MVSCDVAVVVVVVWVGSDRAMRQRPPRRHIHHCVPCGQGQFYPDLVRIGEHIARVALHRAQFL